MKGVGIMAIQVPSTPRQKRKWSLRSLPVVDGDWEVAGQVFETTDGRTCYALAYLRTKYGKVVRRGLWYDYAVRRCRDLDPNTNGGKARAYRVRGTRNVVWLKEDVRQIGKRRAEPIERKTAPGIDGRWLVNSLVWQRADNSCYAIDAKLVADAKEAEDPITNMALVALRRGGLLDYLEVPDVDQERAGKATLIVSSVEDFGRYLAQRKQQRQRAAESTPPPDGWMTHADFCREMGFGKSKTKRISDDIMAISFALRRFRRERPASAVNVPRWDGKQNKLVPEDYHDLAAFEHWRAGRSLHELAAPERRVRTPKTEARAKSRLHRAVRFLQFVLTRAFRHDKDSVPLFTPKRFRRFLYTPPVGETLQPGPALNSRVIRQWAKRAGIAVGRGRTLEQAAAVLKVRYSRVGYQGPSFWRLPGPITIEASEFDADTPQAATASAPTNGRDGPARSRKRRRRKARGPTARELEIAQTVNANGGSCTRAAELLGITVQAVNKAYHKAYEKSGERVSTKRGRPRQLPHDRRGQPVVPAEEGSGVE